MPPPSRARMAMTLSPFAWRSKGGDAEVVSVSCAPAGACVAGGYYTDRSGHAQGFVVTRAR
jgi:hypothetical protein